MKLSRAARLLPYLLFSAALAHAEPPVVPVASPTASPTVAPVVAPVVAPSVAPDSKAVTLRADTIVMDVPADSYLAKGNVRVVQDGVSLLADSVIYRRLSGDAVAEGGILLEKEGDTLRGDRLSLNLGSQQGQLVNGELFIKKSNFRVRGKLMEKTGDEDYRLENGSFTTCDGEKPSWRFEARKLAVTLDEFATARDAVFYAGDLPIFYTPYLIFPVKRDRQSGLLLPKFGSSTKKGAYLDQPYYWAIDPSQEATFTLDLESARGVGEGVDYRYLRKGGSEGRLQGFGIYDSTVEKFRGELDQRHLELISPQTTFASDIHLIADRAYYRDYGEISGDYNRQLLESTVSIDHRWERYGLTGEVRYAEDLVAVDNKATLQRLPTIGFTAAGEKLGPLFFSMDSGFANFQRSALVTGERLQLHPRLSWYAKPTGALDFSLHAGYLQRFYNATEDGNGSGVQQVGQADAGALFSLPLERIYDGRLRHLLIPSLEYGFVQRTWDGGQPFFDWDDRVLGQSIARWSVANVVTGKFAAESGVPEYRDLLYLKLSQGYQLSGERRELLTLVDRQHHLTDLLLESKVIPAKGVTLAVDGGYDPVEGNLSTGNVAIEVKGEGSNLAHLGYRFSRNELDYLEGRLVFPIAQRLSATMLGRYSIDRGGFLESSFALEYKFKCWSVVGTYSERPASPNAPGNISTPGNREFTLNFSLSGLGPLGPMRAF